MFLKSNSPLTRLTMLEGLLLLKCRVVVALGEGIGVERHIAANTLVADGETSFGIEDGVTALSSLDELGVLLLEDLEVPLGLPVPDAVGCEEQIHFLESALVGLGVQGPDHGKSEDICGGEDVVGFLVQSLEHDRAKESEPAISQGPTNDAPGVALGSDLEWEDLSGVQPWDGEPSGAESGCEEEDHSDCTGCKPFCGGGTRWLILTSAGETTSEEKSDTLND